MKIGDRYEATLLHGIGQSRMLWEGTDLTSGEPVLVSLAPAWNPPQSTDDDLVELDDYTIAAVRPWTQGSVCLAALPAPWPPEVLGAAAAALDRLSDEVQVTAENLVWTGQDCQLVSPSSGAGREWSYRAVVAPHQGVPERWGAMTHKGAIRMLNEDGWVARRNPDADVFVVFDGMGGNSGFDNFGAAEALYEGLHGDDPVGSAIDSLREQLQTEPYPQAAGGAAIVAVVIRRRSAEIVWLGDCRAYVLRAGQLRKLTVDHTLVQRMIDEGRMTPEEAMNHPHSNILLACVMAQDSPEPAGRLQLELEPADRLLLCSDGLWRTLSEDVIVDLLEDPDPREAARLLALAASDGTDNVTAMVVDYSRS